MAESNSGNNNSTGKNTAKKVIKTVLKSKVVIIAIIIAFALVMLVSSLKVIHEEDTANGGKNFEEWLESEDEVEYE